MFKRNIYLMYSIACLQGMVFYGPVATLYRQAQGLSILQITAIESISLALCLLLELPWGVAADKIGYRRTMILCSALYFVSKILFWQATGFLAFLAERILLSAVIAGLTGVDTSILYLSCSKEESQHVFGLYNGLQTFGLLAASFVYAALIGEDYRLAGLLTVLSYGAAAILSLLLVEVKAQADCRVSTKDFFRMLKRAATDQNLLVFLIAVAFFNETHQTVTVFLNQLQYTKAHLGSSAIGYVYIAVTIVGLCGVLSARVTQKIGAVSLMRWGYCTAIAVCALLAWTSSAWASILGVILLRAAFSLVGPLQTELQNRQIAEANRASALSINAVIIDSVGVGTNVCFGALAEKSLGVSFGFGAGLCAAGIVLFEIWDRGTGRRFTRRASGGPAGKSHP